MTKNRVTSNGDYPSEALPQGQTYGEYPQKSDIHGLRHAYATHGLGALTQRTYQSYLPFCSSLNDLKSLRRITMRLLRSSNLKQKFGVTLVSSLRQITLQQGMPLHQLQQQLGHRHIQSTLRRTFAGEVRSRLIRVRNAPGGVPEN